MRRTTHHGVATVAGVMALALTPSVANAQIPAQDVVSGNVLLAPASTAQIEARSEADGTSPTGSAALSLPRFAAPRGPVTCLTVTGNRATVGFVDAVDSTSGVLLFVEDNPAEPPDFRDNLRFQLVSGAPTVCPPNTLAFTSSDVIWAGDISVVDVQPSPASKDDCKDGAWRRFDFPNQGQCIASLNRGPKP
jgi:hypothetical protein